MNTRKHGNTIRFLLALWKTNLLASMEYRAAFLSQVIGMALNNAIYFIFWVIFFDRFKQVQGWGLREMFLLFGVVACSFGLAVLLFGNVTRLGEMIATGRLDYYLALPKPVLLHVLASSSTASGMGDFSYGILSFIAARQLSPDTIGRFILGILFSTMIFLAFLVLVQSLAFWTGSGQMLIGTASNAMLTFAMYPITLFDGTAKMVLFTLVPAAFMGAVPAEFVRAFSWTGLLELVAAALILLTLAIGMFTLGLKHYESGSAIVGSN